MKCLYLCDVLKVKQFEELENTYTSKMSEKHNNKSEELANKPHGFGIRHLQSACLFLTVVTCFVARGCISVGVLAMTDPKRKEDPNVTIYDWDKKTQSVILSSFFWGYIVMQLPGGMLAKRFGGKPIILVGLLVNGCTSLALPFFAKLGWLTVCFCRVLMGLTQACLFPTIHTLLGRWLPANERVSMSGIIFGGVQIGTMVSMPLSGILADTALGWQLIYYVISGMLFLVAGLWYWFAASSPAQHKFISAEERQYIEKGLGSIRQAKLRIPWMEIIRTKPLWAVLVANVAGAAAFMVFFGDLPTYMEKGLHKSLQSSALLSTLPFAAMWLGSVASSILSEVLCNRGLVSRLACRNICNSLALFGSAAGMICLSFLGPESSNLAVVVLAGTLMMIGCMFSGYMINILDISYNFGGVILGVTNTFGVLANISAPIVTGFILRNDPTDITRWRIVFLTTAGVCIVSNIFYLTFSSADRQEWDHPEFFDKQNADPEEMKPVIEETTKTDEKEKERS